MLTQKVINGIQITSRLNTFLKTNKPIWSRVGVDRERSMT